MAKMIPVVDGEMRPEYDFTGGVRGKHYQVLREEGYIVRIYHDDGTVTEGHVAGERVVILVDGHGTYLPLTGVGALAFEREDGTTHLVAGALLSNCAGKSDSHSAIRHCKHWNWLLFLLFFDW